MTPESHDVFLSHCSFCGHPHEKRRAVVGPMVSICAVCVDLAVWMLAGMADPPSLTTVQCAAEQALRERNVRELAVLLPQWEKEARTSACNAAFWTRTAEDWKPAHEMVHGTLRECLDRAAHHQSKHSVAAAQIEDTKRWLASAGQQLQDPGESP